ncbi:Zn-binding domain-containing protein [Haladaptatus sp. GCM10025707]|uniref:DUF1998 domain-containing protein n=1 Tax=unclassified Haladaptatus TaxID=2622732 RepID=UPI0023E8D3CE|nr:DUF1998 domain-containing protein [Haladaptatus sp. QDMS2]
MQVDDWKVDRMENVDEKRVMKRIAGAVKEFRNSDEKPWNDIENAAIDIYRPKEVQGDLFPMTMVCRQCNAVFNPKNHKHLASTKGTCTRCSEGELHQLQWVLTHDCGAVSNIMPKACDKPGHGWEDVFLKRGDPDNVNTFEFRCRKCRQKIKSLTGPCSGCSEYVSEASPLQSGSVYYPQREVMVEIPPVGPEARDLVFNDEWARVLMHAHLGLLDLNQEGITLESVATRRGIDGEQLAGIEDRLKEVPADVADDILDALGSAQTGLPGRVEIAKKNETRVDLPNDSTRFSHIAHELFTFIRSTEGYEGPRQHVRNVNRHPVPRPLSDYVDDPKFERKYRQAGLYRKRLRSINVSDAWIVDSFPLLSVVFGYTRDDIQASKVDLKAFEKSASSDALTAYGDRSPSEAIVLEIDRKAIIEWLLDAGVLNGANAPDLEDEVALKTWFLENIDPTELQNPFTPIEDEMTEQVYQLLHTMSHALMSTASQQCGLDSDSISELILPTVPSIILYAESMEHFALGGMFTLFKTRLHDWVDEAKKHAVQCIYDPACIEDESGAACHACMHVSEFTCQSFNNTLDRTVLVGDGAKVPAFWDI